MFHDRYCSPFAARVTYDPQQTRTTEVRRLINSLFGCCANASVMDCLDSESKESERELQLIDGASDVRFKFLCSVTGGPRPSGQSAYLNLKLFNYCALAPADSIIKCGNERPVPMFSPETTVGHHACRVGAQSRPFRSQENLFFQENWFSDGFSEKSVFLKVFRISETIQKKRVYSR